MKTPSKKNVSWLRWSELTPVRRRQALKRPALNDGASLKRGVGLILRSVRRKGDVALRELTARYDRVQLSAIAVSEAEKAQALRQVPAAARTAMERAFSNIEKFHRAQLPVAIKVEVSPGLVCERRPVPLQSVGLYIPGGSASLPSTVLMLGVPALLAGCPSKVLCSPPRPDGRMDPYVVVAAELCGIGSLFKVGGAQAIAALAYGTRSIAKVDKIFGPGNSWVTEAKLQVSSDPEGASCDLPAGPSEVLVIADGNADAGFVAADLLSQAEHGRDSQVVLVSSSAKLLSAVARELPRQLAGLPRAAIARSALAHSRMIEVADLNEALEVANDYAPEHLILQVEDPARWAERVRHAGSVFLGPWSPESVGDYASGTNHVLPTYGYARSFSGVSMDSFFKQITFQRLTASALQQIGPTVETLARLEGLEAHRLAVTRRLRALRRENRALEATL